MEKEVAVIVPPCWALFGVLNQLEATVSDPALGSIAASFSSEALVS